MRYTKFKKNVIYNVKTLNMDRERKMQGCWNIFELKLYLLIYLSLQFLIYDTLGNHKPKICNRYTNKESERNPNVTLKIINISQRKRAKEERNKKNYKSNETQKHSTEWQ